MSNKTILKVFSLGLVTMTLLNVTSQTSLADNAFSEGTTVVRLTRTERESLSQFIEATRERLTRALEDARGAALADAEQIYLDAVIETVIDSYRLGDRTELLTRYALNQGLELAYGVPTADGRELSRKGVLPDDERYQGLRTLVLEDSIVLAMAVLPEDRRAVEAGELLDLPFLAFGYARLKMSRLWSAAVFSETTLYALSIRVLEHWLASVGSSDQDHKARVASEILEVERVLRKERHNVILKDPKRVARRVRELRKLIRRLLDGEARALENQPYPKALSELMTVAIVLTPNEQGQSEVEQPSVSPRRSRQTDNESGETRFEMDASVAAAARADGTVGGRVRGEIYRVDTGSGVPVHKGFTAALGYDVFGFAKTDETSFDYSSVNLRLLPRYVSGSDGKEFEKNWIAYNFLGVGYRHHKNGKFDETEEALFVEPVGFRAKIENINENNTRWQLGVDLNLEASMIRNDPHKTSSVGVKAQMEGGYVGQSGWGVHDRVSLRMNFSNYDGNGDKDDGGGGNDMQAENEFQITAPRKYGGFYGSYTVRYEQLRYEGAAVEELVVKSDPQHWFSLGAKF